MSTPTETLDLGCSAVFQYYYYFKILLFLNFKINLPNFHTPLHLILCPVHNIGAP